MDFLLWACRLVVAGTFAIAAIAKLRDRAGSTAALEGFGVPASLAPLAVTVLVCAELACSVSLLMNPWARTAGLGAIVLLAVFSLAIAWNLARGRTTACHCFGQLSSAPLSWRTLVRNAVLLVMAAAIVNGPAWFPAAGSPAPLGSFRTAVLVSGAFLVLATAFILWMLVELMKQNGRLLLRLEMVEERLQIDPNAVPAPGLPVGSTAPDLELVTPEGESATLRTFEKGKKPILLLFTEPDCHSCGKLRPDLARWREDFSSYFTLLVVSSRQPQSDDAKATLIHKNGGTKYKVEKTPSALFIQEGKVMTELAAGAEAIRMLVAQSTLPQPAQKGDALPSMKLVDLNGGAFDLAALRGRRTLLLFWSTSCGFCQKMLPDVKNWNAHTGAPELLVISSGTAESVRAQGFSGPVLLDPYGACIPTFRARGTPAAILIDEEGRIASDIADGVSGILSLAGIAPVARS